MEREFSREKFFALMWSKPLKDLAPDFGISDVALAKFCRKHRVPLPGRGYWAKLKAGKPVVAFSLPPRGLGRHETISIGRDEWRGREDQESRQREEEIPPPPEFPETLDEVRQRVAKLVGKVVYLKGLDRTHRAVGALGKRTRHGWRSATPLHTHLFWTSRSLGRPTSAGASNW